MQSNLDGDNVPEKISQFAGRLHATRMQNRIHALAIELENPNESSAAAGNNVL